MPDRRRYGSGITRFAWLATAALTVCACSTSASGAGTAGGAQPTGPATALQSGSSRPAAIPQADSPQWRLKWQTDFSQPAPVGSFSDCDNNARLPTAYCSGLPTSLQSQWWAYPAGWPDTATESDLPLGGYYDPAHTVSISSGQMHIKMFRGTGSIHSAAVVPKASIGLLYGKYVERFRVLNPTSAAGYKSSHLLWPTGNSLNYEVDYPEGAWNAGFCIHVHAASEGSATENYCPPSGTWATWNTTAVEWWPNNLAFFLNGTEIYHLTGKWVPDERMSWIIQNETALNGETAPENSSAQLDISYVGVYTYAGKKG